MSGTHSVNSGEESKKTKENQKRFIFLCIARLVDCGRRNVDTNSTSRRVDWFGVVFLRVVKFLSYKLRSEETIPLMDNAVANKLDRKESDIQTSQAKQLTSVASLRTFPNANEWTSIAFANGLTTISRWSETKRESLSIGKTTGGMETVETVEPQTEGPVTSEQDAE